MNKPEAIQFADDRPLSLNDDLCQWAYDAEELIRAMQSRIEALEQDAARYARLPLAEWQDLEYWLDRCYEKGHLENCSDLIAPYEKLCAASMQSEKGGV